jgi:hypothetical protein
MERETKRMAVKRQSKNSNQQYKANRKKHQTSQSINKLLQQE